MWAVETQKRILSQGLKSRSGQGCVLGGSFPLLPASRAPGAPGLTETSLLPPPPLWVPHLPRLPLSSSIAGLKTPPHSLG